MTKNTRAQCSSVMTEERADGDDGNTGGVHDLGVYDLGGFTSWRQPAKRIRRASF